MKETSSSIASERVADAIREAILDARLPPGSRIRQEELAAQFGTSRLPVRLALKRLESDGLVTLVPSSGAWVAKLDLAECVELYRTRERLEPLAIGDVCATISDDEIDAMEHLTIAMEANDDVETFIRLDREFHLRSYASCSMPRLVGMIERFWNTTQHYRRAFALIDNPSRLTLAHCEHRLLVAALRRRDSEDAERILYGHIRRTRLELLMHPGIFENDQPYRRRRSAKREVSC